jgi:hypothetical protein
MPHQAGHHPTEEEETIIRIGNLRCLLATLVVHVSDTDRGSRRVSLLLGEIAGFREMLLDYLSDTLLAQTVAFHGTGEGTPLAEFLQVRNVSLPMFAAWVAKAKDSHLDAADVANAEALVARLRDLLHAVRNPMIPPL